MLRSQYIALRLLTFKSEKKTDLTVPYIFIFSSFKESKERIECYFEADRVRLIFEMAHTDHYV